MVMFQIGDKYDQWIIDTRDYPLGSIKNILEDKTILKIQHNIKYDYKVLKIYNNITMESVWDTMVIEYVLTIGKEAPKGFYSLQNTHRRYYDSDPYSDQLSLFDPFIPKNKRLEISKIDDRPFTEAEIFYGATDIITAFKVYEKQSQLIRENRQEELAKLENEFALVLGDCELNGMPINRERWIELAQWSSNKLEELLFQLNKLHPNVLNWNSSLQVKRLFKDLGIPISINDKKSGEQKDSVQESVIAKYADKFPIIPIYLQYKGMQKLMSTYGLKFLKHVNDTTGRIHSSFVQILNTGRTASTSPNLQNVVSEKPDFPEGKWWREAFEAPEGSSLVIADYSSQELNIVADKSQDWVMLETLRNGGDLHRVAASGLYDKPEEEITGPERKNGKIVNFSIIYGAGADKLAEMFKCSKAKGKVLLDNYFRKFRKLEVLQKESFRNSIENGYISIDTLNRRSYLPDYTEYLYLSKLQYDHNTNPVLKKRFTSLTGKIFRDSANYPIQGTAASMSKYAGILLRRKERENPGLFKILLLIHDEWILECEDDDVNEVIAILNQAMSAAADRFCTSLKIKCEAGVSKNWTK